MYLLYKIAPCTLVRSYGGLSELRCIVQEDEVSSPPPQIQRIFMYAARMLLPIILDLYTWGRIVLVEEKVGACRQVSLTSLLLSTDLQRGATGLRTMERQDYRRIAPNPSHPVPKDWWSDHIKLKKQVALLERDARGFFGTRSDLRQVRK